MAENHLNTALVSVIIPAYNCANYIRETIASVTDQTWRNIEIIVVNDGSTDSTWRVLQEYAAMPGIQLIDQTNRGAAAARNAGYLRSKGSYIKFLDADDLINPDMIAAQLALAKDNPACVISGKWGRFYHHDLRTFRLNPEECWQNMSPIDWL